MNCVEAQGALAVADLRDLATGTGDLADHLRECASCRERADSIAAQTALLASMVRTRARRRRTRRLVLAAGAPIAAAAVFAVGFPVWRGTPARATHSTSALPVAHRVSLTVGPGQSAAVLRTADTTVTVIWFTGAGQ
jgi:hypothetical protein